ncbi:MAG: tRNA guanosine(34) transglycosylase Tgt [Candidatus Magasanikbacteria bacterium]
MFFELTHKDKNSRARTGIIHTDHGDIETPIFMPVGTQATVKTIDCEDLQKLDAQIILGNTYHLHLRPGEDLIHELGGLHKFMNWDRPILTDSGGFQVFSLGLQKDKKIERLKDYENNIKTQQSNNEKLVKIDDDGVTFRSHIDGSAHRFTPENAIETQHKIGADIIMAFDECTPDTAPETYVKEAMERTHRWARRCLDYHKEKIRNSKFEIRNYLFGIIQGSNYKHLREESAKFISSLDFDGIAIGGESVGYNMVATKNILDWVYPYLPENKPHYAMGVGLDPADLLNVVEGGIDMFDCVAPTRLARHGMVYVSPGILSPLRGEAERGYKKNRLNIKNAIFAKDTNPIDNTCTCSTCQNYSRAYIHHLFDADEITGMRLTTIHNIHFMLNLMKETREAIQVDKFQKLKEKWKA